MPASANEDTKHPSKTIHLIRHAQGYHNLRPENVILPDPDLTPYGISQCKTLSAALPFQASSVDLVVASPLRRTLYTALNVFPSLPASTKIIAVPEAQETSAVPSDTGSDPELLAEEFAAQPVDLSLVKSGWNSKTGVWAPEVKPVEERAKVLRKWLWERPEEDIVLVTHGGFLHYLTQDWEGYDPAIGTAWVNCEVRSYTLQDEAGEVRMVETEASRVSRLHNQ